MANDRLVLSRVGFRPGDEKLFIAFRPGGGDAPPPELQVLDENGGLVFGGRLAPWGEIWGKQYFLLRGREPQKPGSYSCRLEGSGDVHRFLVEDGVLQKETLVLTSVSQLEQKKGNKLGWQDCGSDLRAVEGHAIQLMGLVDSYRALKESLEEKERALFEEHILRGGDYISLCQRDDGSFVNEYYAEHSHSSFTLCALAVLALTNAYEALGTVSYLDAAKRGWNYLLAHEGYGRKERLSEIEETRALYGKYAPWLPPEGLRCRDLMLQMRAGADLYRATNDVQYKAAAIKRGLQVCREHQNLDAKRFANGLYGNFLTWKGENSIQRAWEHCGWGYNCGAILPDDVTGFLSLLRQFPEEDCWLDFRSALWHYTYGYLKKACELSPFGIYPLTLLESGEVLFFGPAWHGFNGMYGLMARQAMLLARFFEDRELEEIAVRNLQFIAGCNPAQKGETAGLSFINGVGGEYLSSWTNIPGSISNGISASAQFMTPHADDMEDAPRCFTSEDWIVHNGGWLSGLAAVEPPARLKVKTLMKGKPVQAVVTIGGEAYKTNHRGVLNLAYPPPGRDIKITLSLNGRKASVQKSLIAGHTSVLVFDFAEYLEAALTACGRKKECTLSLSWLGEENGRVSVRLSFQGMKPAQTRWELALPEQKELVIPYEKEESDPEPCYLYAEITGKYAAAVCELGWN